MLSYTNSSQVDKDTLANFWAANSFGFVNVKTMSTKSISHWRWHP